MKKLFNLGIREEHPDYLNKRIKLSNQIAVIMILFASLFIFQFASRWPHLLFVPITAVVTFASIFILNALGANLFARFLSAIGPMVLINTVHAYLIPGGTPLFPQTLAMALSTLVLPFILFDFREIKSLSIAVLLQVVQIWFLPKWVALLEDENHYLYDTFKLSPFLQHTTVGIIVIVGVLFMIVRKGYRFEKEVEKANEERDQQYQEMEKSRQELQQTLAQVEQSQQKEKKRIWASQGLSELNQLLRAVDDLSEAYDQVISWTVKYLKANQGSLYVLEEETAEKVLELKACYAYNRKKFIEQKIQIGEGLVGQSFLEEEYIHLTEIPQNYVRITSGLGEANPNSILIMPLMVNDKVEGILELASFSKFEAHQIDFLQKAGESIASTIARHRINIRTMRLLEESQETTEQMRAQEEEMRQNLEEFSALQEEMQRKETFYQQEIAELKKQLEAKG
jgi:putative methionine-R-sulfoxide reductase with GAF domain